MNEKGISLVETIAALLIVTVILFSFYSFFISTKKTNVQSRSISDATYAAQMEMESIYTLANSGTSSLQQLHSQFLADYSLVSTTTGSCGASSTNIDEFKMHYQFIKTDNHYTYRTNIYELCHFQSTGRVTIELHDTSSAQNIMKANVEGAYIWK